MSAAVARKRKTKKLPNLLQVRVEQAFLDELDAEGYRLGLDRSEYVRLVLSRDLERAKKEREQQAPK